MSVTRNSLGCWGHLPKWTRRLVGNPAPTARVAPAPTRRATPILLRGLCCVVLTIFGIALAGERPADAATTPTTATTTVRFGPEHEITLAEGDTATDTFFDFDTGLFFAPPPEVETELASVRGVDHLTRTIDLFRRGYQPDFSAAWPVTFRWMRDHGIDAACHPTHFRGYTGERGFLRCFYVLSSSRFRDLNETPRRLWDEPEAVLEWLRDWERSEIRRGAFSSSATSTIGYRKEGEWCYPFQTPDGGLGVILVPAPPASDNQPIQFRYKMLENIPPEANETTVGVPNIWVTIVPTTAVYRPDEKYQEAIEIFERPATRVDRSDLELVFRSSDGRRTLHHEPLNPGHASVIWPLTAGDPVYSLESIPPGDCLVAVTHQGARCSNVARFRIDPNLDPKTAPTLEILPMPRYPWSDRLLLGVRATGPNPADREFTNESVYCPSLVIDGAEHQLGMAGWSGPIYPIEPGQRQTEVLYAGNYGPALDPTREHSVAAKVGKFRSAEVTIPADGALERLWDGAAPSVEKTTTFPIRTSGKSAKPAASPSR